MRSSANVGAIYGLFFAVAMFAFLIVLPHPLGARLFWSFITVQLLLGALLVWRRTRLPFATSSMAVAAAGVAIFAALGISPIHPQSHNLAALIGCVAAGVTAGVLMSAQARATPSVWAEWRRHAESCSMIDVLLGRHIPKLRNK
jgi:hypothetical protein